MSSLAPWNQELNRVLDDWSAGGGGIVLSPDVDGMTSCALLAARYDAHVVGIYTTTNILLLDGATREDAAQALWLDHDVSEPGVRCVGQHLIQLRETDLLPRREKMSFNPNLWLNQSWDHSFKGRDGKRRDKYPYGTCHFIANGFGVDPGTVIDDLAALLAHADGTWRTVVDYRANAEIWYDIMFSGDEYLLHLRDVWHSSPEANAKHWELVLRLLNAGVSNTASRAKIAAQLPDHQKRLTGRQSINSRLKPADYIGKVRSVLELCASIVGTSPTIGSTVTDVIHGDVTTEYPDRIPDFDTLMTERQIFSHAFTDFRTLRYTTGINLQQ